MSVLIAVQPFDWHRMFIGDHSWLYLAEIVLRTTIIYFWTVFLVRRISSRAISQLSLIEFILVIALGSAVGDPLFYPDVPLLHCMVVIALIVFLNRGLIWLINEYELVETTVEGYPIQLVHEGIMNPKGIRNAHLNREKLFEHLRLRGVRHLGELEYVFQEQGGQFSVYRLRENDHKPGLAVMPPWDISLPKVFYAGDAPNEQIIIGCTNCGKIIKQEKEDLVPNCQVCKGEEWTDNVVLPSQT